MDHETLATESPEESLMKHLNSILLCVHPDIPDHGLTDQAADLAAKNDAKLKIFHVVSEYPQDMSEWWNVRNPQKLQEKIVRQREGFLQDVVNELKKKGLDHLSYELRWGKTFLEVTREVVRNNHELVMVTSKHKRKLSRMMLESPSGDLLRHCPCALWISKGEVPHRKKRVAAALGGKGGEVSCDGLNRKILRTAAAVAEAGENELYVLHALPIYGGKGVKGEKLRPELIAFRDKLRGELAEKCAKAISDYDVALSRKQVHVLPGGPPAVIPAFASRRGVDLVVMGSIQRGGIPGLLLGSTAERTFDEVDCSVLAVKPDDFVSLVELEEAQQSPDHGRQSAAG